MTNTLADAYLGSFVHLATFYARLDRVFDVNAGFKHPIGQLEEYKFSARHEFNLQTYEYEPAITVSKGNYEFVGLNTKLGLDDINSLSAFVAALTDNTGGKFASVKADWASKSKLVVGGTLTPLTADLGFRVGAGSKDKNVYLEFNVDGKYLWDWVGQPAWDEHGEPLWDEYGEPVWNKFLILFGISSVTLCGTSMVTQFGVA